jgi:hypothetical protein
MEATVIWRREPGLLVWLAEIRGRLPFALYALLVFLEALILYIQHWAR